MEVDPLPPKVRIGREMIVEAAFEIARESGVEGVNARAVARRLNCSTQPVMYHFGSIEALKRAVYARADRFHSAYLLRARGGEACAPLEIGMNYIRFAMEEPRLFRLLFQSGHAGGNSLAELMDSPELAPLLSAMQPAMGLRMPQVKRAFLTIALFAHGYASLLSNNALAFDEAQAADHLSRAFRGAVLAAREEEA